MTILLVVLLTALPVAACGYVGWRLGGRRLAASVGGFALASACGAAALHFDWTRPFGLLTPAVVTLLATVATWLAVRHWMAADRAPAVSRRARFYGTAIGCVWGTVIAGILWIGAALGEGVAAAPEPEATAPPASRGWAHALIRTANRGFVRHLPLLGPLGDEVEATVAILNSSLEARRTLARGRRWRQLTRLPTYDALANDAEVARDLDSVRRGNVVALYRLQRNARVVAFMQEPEVRALLPELRPSSLMHEIEALERNRSPRSD